MVSSVAGSLLVTIEMFPATTAIFWAAYNSDQDSLDIVEHIDFELGSKQGQDVCLTPFQTKVAADVFAEHASDPNLWRQHWDRLCSEAWGE